MCAVEVAASVPRPDFPPDPSKHCRFVGRRKLGAGIEHYLLDIVVVLPFWVVPLQILRLECLDPSAVLAGLATGSHPFLAPWVFRPMRNHHLAMSSHLVLAFESERFLQVLVYSGPAFFLASSDLECPWQHFDVNVPQVAEPVTIASYGLLDRILHRWTC